MTCKASKARKRSGLTIECTADRLSVVRHAWADVDDIFSSIFTGDILGATQIPKARETESDQCASQGIAVSPWPPVLQVIDYNIIISSM